NDPTHFEPHWPKNPFVQRRLEITRSARGSSKWVRIGLMHDDVETWSRVHVDANIPPRWEKMVIHPVHVHASDIDNCSGIASTLLQCTVDDALERIEGGR